MQQRVACEPLTRKPSRGIVATMKIPSLSICIPAYNDEHTIRTIVGDAARIGREIAGSFEIVVINDASRDGTGKILVDLAKKIRELRVITHTKNAGYGGTIRELYYAAKKDWLFTAPGDNQIPISEIRKLLPAAEHADMIIGNRIYRHDPKARLRQSWIYNKLVRLLFRVDVKDVNSVRLMRTSLLTSVKLTKSSAFVDVELIVRAKRAHFRVVNAPIEHIARVGGETGAGGGKWSTIGPTIRDMILFFFRI
jgi:dolichol-phosphate mannosyltransferase